MRRGRGAAVLLVAAVAMLTGCGGSDARSSSPAASTPTHAAKIAPAASSKPATATVAQYASIIAKNKIALGKSLSELQGPHCDWTTPGHVDVRDGYITCSAGSLSVGYEAKTLSLDLQIANKPGTEGYIGPPPQEIKTLVKDTRAQADQLGTASTKAQDCTAAGDTGADCRDKLFKFSANLGFMEEQLAAWDPYLS